MLGKLSALLTAALVAGFCLTDAALADMPGSQDHPRIPRIQGTVIIGYQQSDYDEAEFVTAFENRQFATARAGGRRTRIVYGAPANLTIAQIWKNYGTIFGDLGEITDVYNCNPDTCASNMGAAFVWSSRNRVPVSFNSGDFMYAALGYRDQQYAYFTVTDGSNRYHVSLFTAFLTGLQAPAVRNVRAIHLDVVEEEAFEPTLQVVPPEEITGQIAEKGRIALYGIHFDFDSDVLKDESRPAIASIAAALERDPSLVIYVVGHSDNEGEYRYNLALSGRRAEAVARYLTEQHGIARTRLIAVGVGPVAPVASNRSEEGRALNRRVELVER